MFNLASLRALFWGRFYLLSVLVSTNDYKQIGQHCNILLNSAESWFYSNLLKLKAGKTQKNLVYMDKLCDKISSNNFLLRRLKKMISMSVFKCLLSIKYSLSLWGRASQVDKIFNLQKKTIRVTASMRQTESCSS